MKKTLLVLSLIFSLSVTGQTCTPTNTVSPLLCQDSANNIYIIDPTADVHLAIKDVNGTKQNVTWSQKDFLYLGPGQASPYPGNVAAADIYFNGAPSNQVYTYTASYQIPGCPAVTETFTLVTSGFTYAFCYGTTKTLADINILNISNSTLSWYSNSFGTTSIPNTTTLVEGMTYYVDLGYTGCSTLFPVLVEYSTPVPFGDTTQEFCTTATWTNAGFPPSQTGGMVADLNVSGENLTWYSDAAGTIPITSPGTTALVNGTTYYVNQTINGCESPLLGVTAVERQFPCFKNPGFEDISLGTYGFYDVQPQPIYPTVCAINPSNITNSVTPGPLNSTTDESAAPVFKGFDPLLNYHGLSLSQTSSNTNVSDYAVRLNSYNDKDYGGTYSGKVSKMETDFIAGEVFVFDFSLILRNPQAHTYVETPFFKVRILDKNGNVYTERCVLPYYNQANNFFLNVAQENSPGDIDPDTTEKILYTKWSCLKFNTLGIQGQSATIEFMVGDCAFDVHAGYVYIDNIFVGNLADVTCNDFTCSSPTNLSLTNTTNQSANFSWGFAPNATYGYEWFVYVSGDNPSTATPIKTGFTTTVTATSVTVTGLSPLTNYDFYVSSICGNSYPTTLAGPLVFGTFAKPSNLNIGNSTATSVDVSWTENGTAAQWELQYGPLGFDPMVSGTNLVDGDGVPSETIGGLTPDTDYDIYVRSVYTSGTSAWSGPQTFTTLLSIDQVVFEGFEFYPNPVNEKLSLFAQNNIQQIVLYDLLGKRILKSNPNALESTLDLSQLKPGIYFMEVAIQDSTKMYRIIKE